jgi:uncharacterized protein YbjT (DUF2867 family)
MANALIVGATGLVGSNVLRYTAASGRYDKIYSIQRKLVEDAPASIQQIILESLDNMEDVDIDSIEDVYCCLGTTIKKAGNKEAFRKVDYDYPVKVCAWSATKGAKHLLVISAMGANKKSIFFYNQVKGELEETLSQQYLIPYVSVLRPSLLMGLRTESRPGEKLAVHLANIINPLMVGSLRKFRGIKAEDVAKAMVFIASTTPNQHVRVYLSDELQTLSRNSVIKNA